MRQTADGHGGRLAGSETTLAPRQKFVCRGRGWPWTNEVGVDVRGFHSLCVDHSSFLFPRGSWPAWEGLFPQWLREETWVSGSVCEFKGRPRRPIRAFKHGRNRAYRLEL